MQYSVLHISILIDLLLAKAQLQKNRSGLLKVLEITNDDALVKQEKIDDQFLYKLEDRIKEQNELGKAEILIKSTSYIDNCIHYLGYGNYEDFTEDIKRVQQLVEPLLQMQQHLLFCLPNSKENNLKSLLKRYRFQYDIEVYQDIGQEWLNKLSQKKQPTIWFINSNLFQQQEDALKDWFQKGKRTTVLPYWVTDKISELKSFYEIIGRESILKGNEEQDDFHLMMQLIIRGLNKRKKQKKQSKKVKKISINAVQNRGFVIGELNSKSAPQINNNYYGVDYDMD